MESVNELVLELTNIDQENDQLKDFKISDPPRFSNWDKIKNINLNTMCPRPEDEVASLARDRQGNSILLTREQKIEMRKTGKFTVPSRKYPGEDHVWHVSRLLQTGTDNIKENFYDNLANVYEHFAIDIPEYIYKDESQSVVSGLKSIGSIPHKILEAFIGVPLMKNKEVSIEEQVAKQLVSKYDSEEKQFTFNNGEKGITYEQYKELVDKLFENLTKYNPKSDEELFKIINSVFSISDDDYQQVDELQSETQSFEAQCLIALITTLRNLREDMTEHYNLKDNTVKLYKQELIANHKIKGRSRKWILKQVDKFIDNWEIAYPREDIIKISLERYNFTMAQIFKTYQELKNNKKEQVPAKTITFDFPIWNSNNYIVSHNNYLKEYTAVERTTTHYGWRLAWIGTSIGGRFKKYNKIFFKNMIFGSYGIRAMFGVEDFGVGHQLINVNDEEIPDHHPSPDELISKKQVTPFLGKLRSLWRNIKESRRQSEENADNGILGKSLSRIINRIWNYLIKGPFGTGLILISHPLITVINVIGSLILLVTSPLWSVISGIVVYLFSLLIYDMYGLENKKFKLINIILHNLLIRGIGSIFVGSLMSSFHALAGIISFAFNIFTSIIRYSYDSAIYYTILKFKSRVPRGDSFTTRRISGPELSMNYFSLIDSDDALVFIEFELEKMAIEEYRNNVIKEINKPYKHLIDFYDSLKIIDAKINSNERLNKFNRTKDQLENDLNKTIRDYWDKHPIKESYGTNNCRMTKVELSKAIILGEKLCQEFVTKNFQCVDSVFINKNCNIGDYRALAKICLEKATNNKILIPIENDNEKGFKIEVYNYNIKEFAKSLLTGKETEIKETIDFPNEISKTKDKPYSPITSSTLINNELENELYIYNKGVRELK